MNKYELTVVLSVKLEDEERATALANVQELITRFGGTVTNVDEWGKRKLAYPIDDMTEGYYVLINFKAETSFITELERVYNITDGIMRSMVVRL